MRVIIRKMKRASITSMIVKPRTVPRHRRCDRLRASRAIISLNLPFLSRRPVTVQENAILFSFGRFRVRMQPGRKRVLGDSVKAVRADGTKQGKMGEVRLVHFVALLLVFHLLLLPRTDRDIA